MSGGGGKGGNTSSSGPPPEVMENYQKVMDRASSLAGTPLTQYQGPTVAPFTGDQNAAFSTLRNANNSWSPYFQQAGDALQGAQGNLLNGVQQFGGQTVDQYMQPWQQQVMDKVPQFSGQAVQQYMDPYLDQVVNATRANMQQNNSRQQQDVIGDAISKGAWGGDRAGIAQAELARLQGLSDNQTIGNLYSQGYGQALGQFNNQQQLNSGLLSQGYQGATGQLNNQQQLQYGANAQRANNQLSAANQYAGLGNSQLNNTLAAAQAQLGAGNMQQGLAQSYLNVPYQQFQQQQAYPWQATQYLGNMAMGTGGQSGTTSTQPSPSMLSQLGGLGLTGYGMFGGGLGGLGAAGALGTAAGTLGAASSLGSAAGLAGLALSDRRAKKNIEKVGEKNGINVYDYEYKGSPIRQRGVMAQEVEGIPGAVKEVNGLKMVDYGKLPMNTGGRINYRGKQITDGLMGYAPGGGVDGDILDIFAPEDTELNQPYEMAQNDQGVYQLPENIPDTSSTFVPLPPPVKSMPAGLPSSELKPQPQQAPQPSPEQGEGLMAMLSKGGADPKMAMIAAGLSMAAGQSPNAITNIAQGGLGGLQYLANSREEALKRENMEGDSAARNRQIDLQAKQLEQAAEQFSTLLPLKERELDIKADYYKNRGTGTKIKPTTYKTRKDLKARLEEDFPSIEGNIDKNLMKSIESNFNETYRGNGGDFEDAYEMAVDAATSGKGLKDTGFALGTEYTVPGEEISTEIMEVSTPEEAKALPKGTKFKTPDGRIKIR